MKWISVKTEQPPKDRNIFVLDECGGMANVYWSKKNNRWEFETYEIWIMEFPDEITHWMPLPERPEQ